MIGAWALFLMYAWLAAAIIAAYLANRKGYSERTGLASGLILHVIGVIIWLVVPAKSHSKWKTVGPFGRRKAEDVAPRAAAAADDDGSDDSTTGSRAASA
jgi:uncharacterized membrane protein